MKLETVIVSGFLLLAPPLSRADFKYTESTKITGGALGGLMKFASRVGGKGSLPDSSTYYIKGNRMRVDEGDAKIEIIDLDARRIVRMDTKKKTYVVLTFEEMRAQLEQLRRVQTNQTNGHQQLAAKIKVKPTQNTRTLLGQTTREVQATVEMQSGDEAQAMGQGALTVTSDMWLAPEVHGYEEVRNFFERMLQEMSWSPGGGIGADPRMAKALEEVRKNSAAVSGFPLLATIEMTAKSTDAKTANRPSGENADASDTAIPTNVPTSKGDAANAALGGLLGLRKHKREANARTAEQSDSGSDSDGGALMQATTEVLSFSSSTLDRALFNIPVEYQQVPGRKAGQ